MMDSLSLKLCDIQGRLFEMASAKGYSSEKFVSLFMFSNTARYLDSKYNRMQWSGEEYLLEELAEESSDGLPYTGEIISPEIMYWIGYIYRYWHFYKKMPSTMICRQADFKTMKQNYLMLHTMDPELAIDNLIEIMLQKKQPH